MNGHEQLVDCTAQGQGFSCIGGSRPRCGLDFQCDEYQSLNQDFGRPICDGPELFICNSGVRMWIDCRSLGFEKCDPTLRICRPGAKDAAEK
ncbi:hypothetical protein [Polyangium sp. 6x1]|uniref:hypothetical protein n=1 Tax=Polyangium sp. 6x1 TaxID=3042689 RepID=UPI0024825E85|nr:hypothetical protein [Polyangium sp. 6x1]MDI1451701.1 hypothetical protein [Polyangium sp. 6x1]